MGEEGEPWAWQGAAVSDEWGEHADDWDADPGPRRYAAEAAASLEGVLARRGRTVDGAVVLDFGCGTGLLVEHLVDRAERIDAVDPSPGMRAVLEAKVADRAWRTVRPLAALADPAGPYDVVVCSSVLGFVDDLDAVVRRLAAALAPGGALVHWDWERPDADADAEGEDDGHGLRRGDAERALTAAGLVDVEVADGFELDVDGEVLRPLRGVGWAPAGTVGRARRFG